MMYWPGGGWGWGLMSVGMVLIWALVVIGVIVGIRYFVRTGRRPGYAPAGPRTPEQILAERFARGEIDEDEYRQRLGTLRGIMPPGSAPRADHHDPA